MGAGYAFSSRRKAQCIADTKTTKHRRVTVSEEQTVLKREQDRVCK